MTDTEERVSRSQAGARSERVGCEREFVRKDTEDGEFCTANSEPRREKTENVVAGLVMDVFTPCTC